MKLSAWRVALRIARRDALRTKGRSALILAMIALPVLGVAGADVVYRSATLTPAEKAVRLMGGADALVSTYARGNTVLQPPVAEEGLSGDSPVPGQQPTAEQRKSLSVEPGALIKQLLPVNSRLTPVRTGPSVNTSTSSGLLRVQTAEADLGNPVWRGKINLTAGRAPRAPQEIAATQHFLDQSGLEIGDTTIVRGLEGTPYSITAAVEYPDSLALDQLVALPGKLVEPLERASAAAGLGKKGIAFAAEQWLVQLPSGGRLDWSGVLEINKYGFAVTSHTVMLHPPARSDVPYYVQQDQHSGQASAGTAAMVAATVGGMAMLEIVLLAGPAFAVGARRSRQQLGLIASSGGDRPHIRSVVLGGGVVLGAAGAGAGVALAIGLVAVLRPWAEEWAGRQFGHFALEPLDLLGVAAVGLVTGLLAAIVPAVQASRQNPVAALSGRGSITPTSKKLTVLGMLMLTGGAALALLGAASNVGSSTAVLTGSVIGELGMVVCTPVLVNLFGRIGRWLPLSARLALRDAVRHRGRTAPAVAAVMAAVAGSVAIGIYTASSNEQGRSGYVAAAPAGAVMLSAGWGPTSDWRHLPQQRAAVEAAIRDIGTRGDVFGVSYRGDCRSAGSDCGSVSVLVPPEQQCPASDGTVTGAPSGQESARATGEDPRCRRTDAASGLFGNVPAGDATVLRNLFGVHDPAAEQALAQGRAVVFDPKYFKNGKITLQLTDPPSAHPSRSESTKNFPAKPGNPAQLSGLTNAGETFTQATHQVTLGAVLAHSPAPNAEALVSVATAHKLGLTTAEQGAVWLPDTMPSSSAEQRATAAVAKFGDSSFGVEHGYQPASSLTSLGLTGFAALVAIGAAGIATGLAAADSQRDLTTLEAAGAPPHVRRRLSGVQCGVIAAMGALLGTVCGTVPAVALRMAESSALAALPGQGDNQVIITFPWADIAITLVALPLVAALLATLFTRSRITLLRGSR